MSYLLYSAEEMNRLCVEEQQVEQAAECFSSIHPICPHHNQIYCGQNTPHGCLRKSISGKTDNSYKISS